MQVIAAAAPGKHNIRIRGPMRMHWRELKTDGAEAVDMAWTELTEPRTLAEAYAGVGVEAGAKWETVRAAYRARVQAVHPDHAPEGRRRAAEEQMKVLNICYRMLSDHHAVAGR